MTEHHLLDNLTQLVTQRNTFQTIMADGIVEEDELIEQAKLVQKLINRLETELSPHDFELVTELLAEIVVLHIVSPLGQGDMRPKSVGEILLRQAGQEHEIT